MTLTLRPARRRMKRRIESLPAAGNPAHRCEIWVRRPRTIGKLTCVVCGKV